jgi:hypothetical protein
LLDIFGPHPHHSLVITLQIDFKYLKVKPSAGLIFNVMCFRERTR